MKPQYTFFIKHGNKHLSFDISFTDEPEKIFVTRYTRNENIPIGTAELTAFLRILQLFGQFFPLKCHQLNFEELEDVFNRADGFKLQTPRNEKFRPFYEKTE